MRKSVSFLGILAFVSCTSGVEMMGQEGNPDGDFTDLPVTDKIVSSYIRSNFFQTNRISAKSMNACNDLILLGVNPYADGSLFFEIPDNTVAFSNEKYLPEFRERKGVISFDGNGEMNAGNDLLHTPVIWGNAESGKCNQFTFGTWLYVDEWTQGACLFLKDNGSHRIALKEGARKGEFVFEVDSREVTLTASGFETEKWNHLALTYSVTANNKGIHLYVNGKKAASDLSWGDKLPFVRTQMKLAKGFKGKLDETFFNGLPLSENEVQKVMEKAIDFSTWNMSKTLAYWKYDDAESYGKDSHTWVEIMKQVKAQLSAKNIKFRVGVTAGDWKTMCAKEVYRDSFVKNVVKLVGQYAFDGVDLDFEWPLNKEEFDNYSKTIVELKKALGKGSVLTVSLHPLYYTISKEAIQGVDHISMQCYGPSVDRFPYDTYVKEAQEVLKYGIPKEKLVMGLPFYGAAEGKQGTVAYWNLVQENLIDRPDKDEVVYQGKKYVFNGASTIVRKTQYVMDNDLAGVMTWDLATDVPWENPWCLTKVMVETMASPAAH